MGGCVLCKGGSRDESAELKFRWKSSCCGKSPCLCTSVLPVFFFCTCLLFCVTFLCNMVVKVLLSCLVSGVSFLWFWLCSTFETSLWFLVVTLKMKVADWTQFYSGGCLPKRLPIW